MFICNQQREGEVFQGGDSPGDVSEIRLLNGLVLISQAVEGHG